MEKNKDLNFDSDSIIEEIELQLEEILQQKKLDVEKELEERINQEKEEARKRVVQIEEEMAADKEALVSYRDIISEIEIKKKEIKHKIKEHLDNVAGYQKEIESKTSQTLEELAVVNDLSQEIEDINKNAEEKVNLLRKDLEDKYGIVPVIPEDTGQQEVSSLIKSELERLNQIKELLKTNEPSDVSQEPDLIQDEEKSAAEEPAAESVEEETAASEPDMEEEQVVESEEEEPKIINLGSDSTESETVELSEGDFPPPVVEAEEKPEEPPQETEPEAESEEKDAAFSVLDKYRKTNGFQGESEIVYYENENKMMLDAEYIVVSISNCAEEAKKLYIKLANTDSPKEQFFVKQEIIQHQETIRKIMLSTIRMCEKDSDFLPKFTADILNLDVLKNILEKVSMENWSNQEDFASFDEFTKQLKDDFYARITPPDEYLQSIMEELKISV